MLEGVQGSERSQQEVPTEAGSEEPQLEEQGLQREAGGALHKPSFWGQGWEAEASSLGNRLWRIE